MPGFETTLQDLYKLLQHPYGNACHNMDQMGQRFSLHHSGAGNPEGRPHLGMTQRRSGKPRK